jgi:hypothetical protein
VSDDTLQPYHRISDMADVEIGALLADGLMVPEGATVLYGPGGVGKGHVACEAIRNLLPHGPVLIVDYEAHPSEWKRRLAAMLTPVQQEQVAHMVPPQSLPKSEQLIRAVVREVGARALILDSYQAATPDGKAHADIADVPRDMFGSIARIGVPALILAHVTKSGGEHQPYPYGSVFVHSYARMTWSMAKRSQDDEPLRVELRNQKLNDRQLELPRVYEFVYGPYGLRAHREVIMTRAEAILMVLQASDVPMTPAKIYTALDYRGWLAEGQTVDNIGALLRMDRKDRFIRVPQGWRAAK